MPTRAEWGRAYARQAKSDWKICERFRSDQEAPRCYELHFLQMAAEKIAKAYRFRDTRTAEADLLTRHVGFEKFINQFLQSPRVLGEFQRRTDQLRVLRQQCRQLAGEVERLAPAVDSTNRPQNCEYPWSDGERVTLPLDYGFPNLSFLEAGGGRAFLRWLTIAIEEYDLIALT